MKRLIIFFLFLSCTHLMFAQTHPLTDQLKSIITGKQATVGVAIIFNGSELMTINDQYRFPMMSVAKFHQALKTIDYVTKNDQTLNTEIFVKKSTLRPDTHSPLRDNYPDGDFMITIGDLLRYTISQSDNIASDILYKHIGGPKAVNEYIEKLGVKNVSIELTEKEMEESDMHQYQNWCKPSSAALLMETFLQNDLFPRPYKVFLERALIESTTGKDKLKGLLPAKKVMVGHKTGSSGRNEFGIKIADNDMGFVLLPDGSHYTIAVFIMNSKETDKQNAAIIAEISKAVYDYFIAHSAEIKGK